MDVAVPNASAKIAFRTASISIRLKLGLTVFLIRVDSCVFVAKRVYDANHAHDAASL
jgi:hypothetical protein